MYWCCHDRYQSIPAGTCAGGIAVVIDVLRASTTIVTALFHGASSVLPVVSIGDAKAAALGGRLLGGERGGVRIEGFDLGNSPLEYTAARVDGRSVVITTTNGTAALHACRDAREILIGAIVNRTAVADAMRRLAHDDDHVHLVCAGTEGAVSAEDVLAAGAILDAASVASPDAMLDPAARAAREFFRRVAARGDLPTALVEEFRQSPGGANLEQLGMQADLPACAAIDSMPLVPRLDRTTGYLTFEMVPATKSG